VGKEINFVPLQSNPPQGVYYTTLCITKSSFPDEPCTSKALVGRWNWKRNR